MRACNGCSGLWIARATIAALRDVSPSAHGWLGEPPSATASAANTLARTVGKRRCPVCGAVMLGYAFGGGHVEVEACDPCEHVFLDRGELGAIVDEARHGIAMTEEAQQALHRSRVASTWNRLTSAEGALAVLGLTAVYVFVKLAVGLGPSAVVFVGAAAVALTFFVWQRSRLARERQKAEERLVRLADAEAWRLEKSERGASGATPAAPRKRHLHSCAFCGAPLPPDSTRCTACDSDFGA